MPSEYENVTNESPYTELNPETHQIGDRITTMDTGDYIHPDMNHGRNGEQSNSVRENSAFQMGEGDYIHPI